VEHADEGWWLRLRSRHFAHFLHIDDAAFAADENWLHLAPGIERRVALLPGDDPAATPSGQISALNMDRIVHYAGRT